VLSLLELVFSLFSQDRAERKDSNYFLVMVSVFIVIGLVAVAATVYANRAGLSLLPSAALGKLAQ